MGAREMDGRRRFGLPAALAAAVLVVVAACGSGTASPDTSPSASPTTASSTTATTEVIAPPLSSAPESSETPSSTPEPTPVTSVESSVAEPVVSETPDPPAASEPPPTSTPAPPTTTATPSPSPTPTPTSTGVRGDGSGRTVVIDPGHNGANGANPSVINAPVDAGFGETKPCNTTGTETNDGYSEHRFTWAVAGRVAALLTASGVNVVMTRDSDDGVGPCVNERARIGNEAGADAVVSIHGDGAAAGDRGFYAMTSERLPNGADVGDASLALATSVRDALVGAGAEPSNYVGSGGLWKRDDLAGLNLSQVPTTVVELGNMRDGQDAAFMVSDAGQDLLAAGIAQGILDYLAAG